MTSILSAWTYLLVAWLVALVAAVSWKMLTGTIRTAGLLDDDQGNLSVERVQLMVVTVFGAIAYAVAALKGFEPSAAKHQLPEVPTTLLYAVAGSNTFYVAAKQLRFLYRAPR